MVFGKEEIVKKRSTFILLFILLLGIEILIGKYASGWIRNSLGDILVVILLYAFCRSVYTGNLPKWFVLPAGILLFAYGVEFLQLWGFCDRLGITNRLLRIIIGTGFSIGDLLCYTIGSIPCFLAEYFRK